MIKTTNQNKNKLLTKYCKQFHKNNTNSSLELKGDVTQKYNLKKNFSQFNLLHLYNQNTPCSQLHCLIED